MERETRSFPIELRVSRDGAKAPRIVGHAAVFGQLSQDLGGFKEKVARGAFSKTLQEKADVRALLNHDSNYVIGRTKSGTLRLSQDENGLAVDVDPPDTTWARDMLVTMERGDIDQMSFQFRVVKDSWNDDDRNAIVRTLEEVELFDVSPVTFPAYPQTSVSVKRHLEELQAKPGTPHLAEGQKPEDALHFARRKRVEAGLSERDL